MRVLVIGSKRHLAEEQKARFDIACVEIGKALAQSGRHKLVVCSTSQNTADPFVAKGFQSVDKANTIDIILPADKGKTEFQKVFGISNEKEQSSQKEIQLNYEPQSSELWRVIHLSAINHADAVIAIGGSGGEQGSPETPRK